ncbi:hypothetical protein [Streptomyces sp. NPDC012888]|uniref:COG1470 family protein n=1 Tax=Streptomyces sp. NPDC012888 TaxID=3364855 RepID=UPI003686651A
MPARHPRRPPAAPAVAPAPVIAPAPAAVLAVLALLLGLALPLCAAGPARAAEPEWTAGPAGPPGAPARPFFYLEGAPGAVLEDRLALSNPTGRERAITLRGADAYNAEGGALAVRPARESSGAGRWVSFGAHATVKVPPRSRAVVPFTVTVPPDAVPGDHPVALVAAEPGREAGVRVHLRVSGPTLAALTVEDVSVGGRGAAAEVRYALVNRGNTALAPQLEIRADGLFGGVEGRPARRLPVELLPGQRVVLTEPWPGAPVFDAVDLTLTVTAPGGARATATASARFVPRGVAGWTGAGLLLAVAALTAHRLAGRGRGRGPGRGRAAPAEPPAPPAPPVREHELTGASK